MDFVIGAIVVLAVWAFFSMLARAKGYKAFTVRDEAEPWLEEYGIKSSSVVFSVYKNVAVNEGAACLVGQGEFKEGGEIGFVLEVVPGQGVVDYVQIEPPAIASHHQKCYHAAVMSGKCLMDVMEDLARRHREAHGLAE